MASGNGVTSLTGQGTQATDTRGRTRSFRKALIDVDHERWPAIIRDFSKFGVRLESAAPLVRGLYVVIDIDGRGTIPGIVRWRRPRMAGVRLLRSLPTQWVVQPADSG